MKKNYLIQYLLIVLGTILYFWANIQRAAVPGAIFDVLQFDLKANAASITALGASFMYIYALSQLIVGILVSRYGGFRVITSGTMIFAAGSLIFPFSQSIWLLYLSRALIGLGSATFYLGLIQEIRHSVSKNNFGIVLSLILFVGYMGGIIANAPLVLCVKHIGWRNSFAFAGLCILLTSLIFVFLKLFIKNRETDKSVHFDFSFFKNILIKRENRLLYYFGIVNFAIYYVLQTIIGKKFLEDFCKISTMKAAIILSLMGALYAISGPILAYLCKILLNRRTPFLRFAAINTFTSMFFILICIIFDIRTQYIIIFFFSIAFMASLSSLIVPLLHDLNTPQEAGTAVSIMSSSFYIGVASLANLIGYILNNFGYTVAQNGVVIYSSFSYMIIFSLLGGLALFSLLSSFRIKESQKTLRFLQMCHYMEDKYGEKWHDKYEHDFYLNI